MWAESSTARNKAVEGVPKLAYMASRLMSLHVTYWRSALEQKVTAGGANALCPSLPDVASRIGRNISSNGHFEGARGGERRRGSEAWFCYALLSVDFRECYRRGIFWWGEVCASHILRLFRGPH